jgi:hypothetical protein
MARARGAHRCGGGAGGAAGDAEAGWWAPASRGAEPTCGRGGGRAQQPFLIAQIPRTKGLRDQLEPLVAVLKRLELPPN